MVIQQPVGVDNVTVFTYDVEFSRMGISASFASIHEFFLLPERFSFIFLRRRCSDALHQRVSRQPSLDLLREQTPKKGVPLEGKNSSFGMCNFQLLTSVERCDRSIALIIQSCVLFSYQGETPNRSQGLLLRGSSSDPKWLFRRITSVVLRTESFQKEREHRLLVARQQIQ